MSRPISWHNGASVYREMDCWDRRPPLRRHEKSFYPAGGPAIISGPLARTPRRGRGRRLVRRRQCLPTVTVMDRRHMRDGEPVLLGFVLHRRRGTTVAEPLNDVEEH